VQWHLPPFKKKQQTGHLPGEIWLTTMPPFIINEALLACLYFGEYPQTVAWSAQPLCWSSWEYLLPHHSQGSSTERWSQNTQGRYILRGSLTSPFIIINSVETTAPFNVVTHPRCREREINHWKTFQPLAAIESVTLGNKCQVLNC